MPSTLNPRLPLIWHGGDYNPEQWPPATWDEDMRLMQASHFKVATVGVFAWVSLQPAEDRFTFDWLDQVLDKLTTSERFVCLATPSMAQPAWMSRAYPDVLRADDNGVRRHHGRRTNYCPNSPNYRRLAAGLAGRLAERYAAHPALVMWHVSNEYGGACYCQTCAEAFRAWLQGRYASLDELNQRWWTAFWSHTYTDWAEIEPPYANGESLTAALSLDYRRFQSASMLECFKLERDAIRQHSPDVPITTNMMGAYVHLDYRAWAPELDVISWDCYPWPSADPGDIASAGGYLAGLGDLVASIVARVYRVTTRRELGSLPRPLPGVSPEFWPEDWRTYQGHDGYGWGATTANLLLRNLVGVHESRSTEHWTLDLAPAFPASLLTPGQQYTVRNLHYRGARFDLTYRVLPDAALEAHLALHTAPRLASVSLDGHTVYSAPAASSQHSFFLTNAQRHTLTLR